jgi:hypothetical protein
MKMVLERRCWITSTTERGEKPHEEERPRSVWDLERGKRGVICDLEYWREVWSDGLLESWSLGDKLYPYSRSIERTSPATRDHLTMVGTQVHVVLLLNLLVLQSPPSFIERFMLT